MTTIRTVKVGIVPIYIHCRRYLISKKSCDVECDIVCRLNNDGSKDIRSLYDIAKEFHVTSYQLKCAVHNGIIHAEMFQRGSQQVMFISKDEVAEKLDVIRAYPKKSAEEIERQKNYSRPRYKKNNTLAAEGSSDDLCTITKASREFGVDYEKLYNALEFGIIRWRTISGRTKRFLSRTEILENLELIKKGSRIFYRLLNMKRQQLSQERQQILEINQQMNASVPVHVDSNLPQKYQETKGLTV